MAVKASATITLSFMVDVKATYRYYKLQASTASAPEVPTTAIPSGWTDSEPTYIEGSTNTLYIVDKTVFTNDTFVYSAVSKSTSYEAAKAAYNKAVNAQNTANEASKTATNFMQFVDGEGLYVGNKQSGTWEGVRTRMDTDSFDVIDQDGNTLASYGAEMSITPNNTSGYKIKMGDSVTIGTRYPGSSEGYGSVVIGYNGRAVQSYSYAEGYQTLASGNYTHAEGWKTTASGANAHSENNNTTASGDASHAEGLATTASNFGSHSEGGTTTASGEYSHAEGRDTIASGHSSHSEGNKTTASGKYSHASGIATKATAAGQFVIGSNNTVDDNAIFIIGNGSYTDISGTITPGTPSNALEVDWNGNLTTSGSIETGDIYCSGINCSGINSIDPNANFIEISNSISVNGDIVCGYVDASGDIIASGNIYYNIPVSSYDVNALTNTGKYYCGNDATNKPAEPGFTTGKNGWVEVMRYTDSYVHQRYTTYTGNVYERVMIEGTWGQWRIVYYHYAMESTAAETLVINFLSNYPYMINIYACNSSNVPSGNYSYTATHSVTTAAARLNANTPALSSTYGTISANASGITIKSTAAYKLYVTVTQ